MCSDVSENRRAAWWSNFFYNNYEGSLPFTRPDEETELN